MSTIAIPYHAINDTMNEMVKLNFLYPETKMDIEKMIEIIESATSDMQSSFATLSSLSSQEAKAELAVLSGFFKILKKVKSQIVLIDDIEFVELKKIMLKFYKSYKHIIDVLKTISTYDNPQVNEGEYIVFEGNEFEDFSKKLLEGKKLDYSKLRKTTLHGAEHTI